MKKNENNNNKESVKELLTYNDIFWYIYNIEYNNNHILKIEEILKLLNFDEVSIEVFNFWKIKEMKLLFSNHIKKLFAKLLKFKKKIKKNENSNEKDDIGNSEFVYDKENLMYEDLIYKKTYRKVVKNKEINSLLLIENPEINLYDNINENQMLLSSKKNCVMLNFKEFLEHDTFKLDYRNNFQMIFSEVEFFIAPTNIDYSDKHFWKKNTNYKKGKKFTNFNKLNQYLNNFDKIKNLSKKISNIRTGLLNKILVCENFNLKLSNYANKKLQFDFSKPINLNKNLLLLNPLDDRCNKWGNSYRSNNLKLNINNVLATLDSISYSSLITSFKFLINTLTKKNHKKISDEKMIIDFLKKYKYEECINKFEKKIESFDKEKKEKYNNKSILETFLNIKFNNFYIFMIKNDQAFLSIKMDETNIINEIFNNKEMNFDLNLKNPIIYNLNADKFSNLILLKVNNSLNNKESSIFISYKYFKIALDKIDFQICDSFIFNICPIYFNGDVKTIRLIYAFLFSKLNNRNKEEYIKIDDKFFKYNPEFYFQKKDLMLIDLEKKEVEEKGQSVPIYFKNIQINNLEANWTLKSDNIFLNFNQIKLFMKEYKKEKILLSFNEIINKYFNNLRNTLLTSYIKYKLTFSKKK